MGTAGAPSEPRKPVCRYEGNADAGLGRGLFPGAATHLCRSDPAKAEPGGTALPAAVRARLGLLPLPFTIPFRRLDPHRRGRKGAVTATGSRVMIALKSLCCCATVA